MFVIQGRRGRLDDMKTYRMNAIRRLAFAAICATSLSSAADNPVADDVLFLVLGKMSLYDQSPEGDIALRNHHFVAEIMPKAGRAILSGTLTRIAEPTQVFDFNPEGNAWLAHGARVMDPNELHQLHPDGDYRFSYETQSGTMAAQTLTLTRRNEIADMPSAARVAAKQHGERVSGSVIKAGADLTLSWDPMPGNHKATESELADLIFVLGFDCFGNNIAHSGRPFQGGPYLTYKDSSYTVPGEAIKSGLNYTFIVEQATADTETFEGVPGISTYATLTFIKYRSAGSPTGEACPQ